MTQLILTNLFEGLSSFNIEDSATHMLGLTGYVREGLHFAFSFAIFIFKVLIYYLVILFIVVRRKYVGVI